MVRGKGGVGKTTCAAATALAVAAAAPDRRAFCSPPIRRTRSATFSKRPSRTNRASFPDGPGNLDVRELDAVLALRRAREEYASAIDALFDRAIGSSVDAAHDRRVMHGLIDLAPPGLDELVAILEVTTLMVGDGSGTWHHIVLDTAPTGHALRLLEMPALILTGPAL